MLTSINYLHKHYIIVVPTINIHNVFLQSDWPLARTVWDITRNKSVRSKANSAHEVPKGDSGRQAWIDIISSTTDKSTQNIGDLQYLNRFFSELKKIDSMGTGTLLFK